MFIQILASNSHCCALYRRLSLAEKCVPCPAASIERRKKCGTAETLFRFSDQPLLSSAVESCPKQACLTVKAT